MYHGEDWLAFKPEGKKPMQEIQHANNNRFKKVGRKKRREEGKDEKEEEKGGESGTRGHRGVWAGGRGVSPQGV